MEYCTTVWSPYLKRDVISIERVQRHYTRKIFQRCGIHFLSYHDRLYKLNIKTLEYRRIEFDLMMLYKIIHKIVDLPFSDLFRYYHSPYSTRRHNYCLESRPLNNLTSRNFYANRVVPIWNSLPSEIVNKETYQSFRTALKSYDLSQIYQFLVND